jgi:hypothetical protein
MSLTDILRQVEQYAKANSPSILTGIAVVGTVATAYLTGKAAVDADRILRELQNRREAEGDKEPYSTKEKIEVVWVEFIPPVVSGAVTIGCIIGANKIGSRRAAAVAAAYSLSEKAFSEYKDKIVKTIGDKKETKVRNEIAQDRVSKSPPVASQIILTGGPVLCCDGMSMRYFMSDLETIRKAQNDINNQINMHQYASLTDFYDNLDLPKTQMSDEVGWNQDQLLTLNFSATLTPDNRPCMMIEYRAKPIRDFYKLQ